MSLVFSDTTTKKGIIQVIEKKLSFQDADITSDTLLFARFTTEINLALDRLMSIVIPASGTWQFDDSNQTDYPIIKTNIVSGQQDYTFTTDGSGNLILDIYKVMILPTSTATIYQEIFSVDQQSQETDIATENPSAVGVPFEYDKTANGLFLNSKPNYNATNGLKLFINRESTYFTVSDTTKKPGFVGIFHEYLALYAAYKYATEKSLSIAGGRLRNGAFTGMALEVNDMEKAIADYYGQRTKDQRNIIRPLNKEYR